MPAYSLYGLSVYSEFPLKGLASAQHASRQADLVIHLGSLPPMDSFRENGSWYEGRERDAAGNPTVVIRRLGESGAFWFRHAEGPTDYVIDGREVFASWPDRIAAEDVLHYLFGPVLGLILHARATPCLHASVVVVEDHAIGLLGPPGAGKSTAAAGFARRGYQVLTDDLMVLDERGGRFLVQPGPTFVRLRSDSVEALYGSPDALPRLVPVLGKHYFDLMAAQAYCDEPKPLRAIYILDDQPGSSCGPSAEAMSTRDALLGVISHSYAAKLPGRLERRRKFELLSGLVSRVPARKLTGTDKLDHDGSLQSLVLEDLRHRLGASDAAA